MNYNIEEPLTSLLNLLEKKIINVSIMYIYILFHGLVLILVLFRVLFSSIQQQFERRIAIIETLGRLKWKQDKENANFPALRERTFSILIQTLQSNGYKVNKLSTQCSIPLSFLLHPIFPF